MFGSCHQLFIMIGLVITTFIGMGLPMNGDTKDLRKSLIWRFSYGGTAIFSIIQILLMAFIYKDESPPFYYANGNKNMVF